MKKFISIILCLVMVSSVIPFSIISANASMADEAEDYELGVKYEGQTSIYYRFVLTQKSHITLKFTNKNFDLNIYDVLGNIVCNNDDIKTKEKYNKTTELYTTKYGKNLGKGTYYLFVEEWNYRDGYYSVILDREPTIKLSKVSLTSLKSTKKGQFVAKCKKESNAIGYQFQYSLSERFNYKVKTVKSTGTKKTVKKLLKGKRYYVRVRPYTIYTDGTYVYGQYSMPKSVKIKKK